MDVKKYQNYYFSLLAFEKNLRQFTQTKTKDRDLTLSHVMILIYLFTNGDCGQKELTVTFNASSAAMAVSIARLEEKGLIEKAADEEDKRNNIISLSKNGEAYLSALLVDRTEPETAEDAITEEELQQLTKLQNKLFRQLKGITVPE